MFKFITDFIRDIRRYDERSSITNEFDGYGFMKRVYGIESMPRFETVAKLARTDGMTRAYNRLAFDDFAEKEIAAAQRYKDPLAVVALNIDGFKQLTTQYSYLVCDEIIVTVSKILREGVRTSDLLFRWVGHMFIILMPHTDIKGAEIATEKFKKEIQNHDFGHNLGQITCSFGVIEFETDDHIDSLIKRMEAALSSAKEGGGNRIKTLTKAEYHDAG